MAEGGLLKKDVLMAKLRSVVASQVSIEGTAQWCLFYSREAATIVAAWEQEVQRAPPERRLALLYLANHVLQESRKKKGREFGDEFSKVMAKAVRELLRSGDSKARSAVARVVGVWEERRVFGGALIKDLKELIAKVEAAAKQAASKNGSDDARRKVCSRGGCWVLGRAVGRAGGRACRTQRTHAAHAPGRATR